MFKKLLLKIKINLLFLKKNIFGFNKTFVFQDKRYKYFYHLYNNTWDNERAIEIPIIMSEIDYFKNKRILEVGNVLSHYFYINHEVIDKYESYKGVINEDVSFFKPKYKYDLIVSISTLEHVGLDDNIKKPERFIKAIQNLKKIINDSGKILITIPLGFNHYVDNLIINNEIKFNQKNFFKKTSKKNDWEEISLNNIETFKYDCPFPGANIVMFGIIKNK